MGIFGTGVRDGVNSTDKQSSTAGVYDYPLKSMWEKLPPEDYNWMIDGCGSAKRGYTFEKYVNSPLGENTMDNFITYIKYQDDLDPTLLKEWEAAGTRKDVFDYKDPNNNWAVYTPISAFEPGNTKKYPVLFCLHGNTDTILMAESYGYAKVGAREGYITVIPYANNHETIVEDMAKMMEKLRTEYPIDESRIYVAGFSKGGLATMTLALAYPTLFAAIAPGGLNLVINFGGLGAASSTDPRWNDMAVHGMPVVNLFGILDGSEPYPLRPDAETAVVYTKWLEVNGINVTVTPDSIVAMANSPNRVEREVGAPFTRMYTQVYDTNYYIGQYVNGKEQAPVELVAIENMPHWPSGYFAKVTWDFLKHWSRDTGTKESVYSN
jgi:poly(3-hydroxybutyrate) depolymerase